MISQEALDSFKKIYFKEFGKQLTDVEANSMGLELLMFFELIYKPIPEKDEKILKLLKE